MDPHATPGSFGTPGSQFQTFFNPHLQKDNSPETRKKQQEAALDALIGELDTSYIDLPELISEEELQASRANGNAPKH